MFEKYFKDTVYMNSILSPAIILYKAMTTSNMRRITYGSFPEIILNETMKINYDKDKISKLFYIDRSYYTEPTISLYLLSLDDFVNDKIMKIKNSLFLFNNDSTENLISELYNYLPRKQTLYDHFKNEYDDYININVLVYNELIRNFNNIQSGDVSVDKLVDLSKKIMNLSCYIPDKEKYNNKNFLDILKINMDIYNEITNIKLNKGVY